MFKKKKNNSLPMFDYTRWESDFGFLLLIMNRKINISKEYEIKPFENQLQKSSDYIRDTDIKSEYTKLVDEIFDTLSDSYKTFLINKYFKNEKKLIEFISETVYDELLRASINENNKKITNQYSHQMAKNISDMNHLNEKEK